MRLCEQIRSNAVFSFRFVYIYVISFVIDEVESNDISNLHNFRNLSDGRILVIFIFIDLKI